MSSNDSNGIVRKVSPLDHWFYCENNLSQYLNSSQRYLIAVDVQQDDGSWNVPIPSEATIAQARQQKFQNDKPIFEKSKRKKKKTKLNVIFAKLAMLVQLGKQKRNYGSHATDQDPSLISEFDYETNSSARNDAETDDKVSSDSTIVNSQLDKRGTHGLVGLDNLGNTCYINATLQCLVHIDCFREYFLTDEYRFDVNVSSKFGMSGKLAVAFSNLLHQIFYTNDPILSPFEFRRIIGRFDPRFANYEQQDAQEFLTVFLTGIHEDLNRITEKPFVEDPGSSARPDHEVASEYFDNYLMREDSFVTTLFSGQFKSKKRCLSCNRTNTSFEPFTSLSLPLPEVRSLYKTVVIMFIGYAIPPTKVSVELRFEAQMSDLLHAICQLELELPSTVTVSDDLKIVEQNRNNNLQSPLQSDDGSETLSDGPKRKLKHSIRTKIKLEPDKIMFAEVHKNYVYRRLTPSRLVSSLDNQEISLVCFQIDKPHFSDWDSNQPFKVGNSVLWQKKTGDGNSSVMKFGIVLEVKQKKAPNLPNNGTNNNSNFNQYMDMFGGNHRALDPSSPTSIVSDLINGADFQRITTNDYAYTIQLDRNKKIYTDVQHEELKIKPDHGIFVNFIHRTTNYVDRFFINNTRRVLFAMPQIIRIFPHGTKGIELYKIVWNAVQRLFDVWQPTPLEVLTTTSSNNIPLDSPSSKLDPSSKGTPKNDNDDDDGRRNAWMSRTVSRRLSHSKWNVSRKEKKTNPLASSTHLSSTMVRDTSSKNFVSPRARTKRLKSFNFNAHSVKFAKSMSIKGRMGTPKKQDSTDVDIYTPELIQERWGFVLRRVTRDGISCSLCFWLDGCAGCIIPDTETTEYCESLRDDETLAIDWDRHVVDESFNARLSQIILEDASVRLSEKKKQNETSIFDCLQTFTKEETISAFCPRCTKEKGNYSETKQRTSLSLWAGPPILVLQLKRFGMENSVMKLDNLVTFPIEDLNLSEFFAKDDSLTILHDRAKNGIGPRYDGYDADDSDIEFGLFGVSNSLFGDNIQNSSNHNNAKTNINLTSDNDKSSDTSNNEMSQSIQQNNKQNLRRQLQNKFNLFFKEEESTKIIIEDEVIFETRKVDDTFKKENKPNTETKEKLHYNFQDDDDIPPSQINTIFTKPKSQLSREKASRVRTNYKLLAVINHMGNLKGGHYTSHIRFQKTNRWFNFNDQRVEEISPRVVQSRGAYILFYIRDDYESYINPREIFPRTHDEMADTMTIEKRNWTRKQTNLPGYLPQYQNLTSKSTESNCKVM